MRLPCMPLSSNGERERKYGICCTPLNARRRYSPKVPYWEAVLLVKKLLLIMVADTWITNSVQQALGGVGINTAYLILLEYKQPMLFHPSKTLKGRNFFHAIERTASITSVTGSLLAVRKTLPTRSQLRSRLTQLRR